MPPQTGLAGLCRGDGSFDHAAGGSQGSGRLPFRAAIQGVIDVGALYDICQTVMTQLEVRNPNPMDLLVAKGEVARKAGFMVSLVSPGDADDPAKIEGVRAAAREYGIQL